MYTCICTVVMVLPNLGPGSVGPGRRCEVEHCESIILWIIVSIYMYASRECPGGAYPMHKMEEFRLG